MANTTKLLRVMDSTPWFRDIYQPCSPRVWGYQTPQFRGWKYAVGELRKEPFQYFKLALFTLADPKPQGWHQVTQTPGLKKRTGVESQLCAEL